MRRTLEERELGTQLLIGHATAPIMAGLSPKVSILQAVGGHILVTAHGLLRNLT